MSKEDVKRRVEVIEEYYNKPLTQLVVSLMKEPIMRHTGGKYCHVISVGEGDSGEMLVTFKLLGNGRVYVTELTKFLYPVGKVESDTPDLGQNSGYFFVKDFDLQLNLVETKDLIKELRERDNGVHINDSDILHDEYLIARVMDGKVFDVFNSFPNKEDAQENLRRNKRNNKYRGDSITVIRRVWYKESK